MAFINAHPRIGMFVVPFGHVPPSRLPYLGIYLQIYLTAPGTLE